MRIDRLLLIVGWLLCGIGCAFAQTGTAKTQTVLDLEINALFIDNATNQITPFDLRQVTLDLVASYGNLNTANSWSALQTFNDGLAIATPSGTAHGINSAQSSGAVSVAGVPSGFIFGGGPQFTYNLFSITDQINVTGVGTTFTGGFGVGMVTGGATSQGTKVALAVQLLSQIAGANPPTARDLIGANIAAIAQVPEGGTGTGAGTSKGTLFGTGIGANLTSGATNYFSVSGGEVDVGIANGASAYARLGWSIVDNSNLQAASIYDTAFEIGAATVGWKMGLMFSSLHGIQPISTGGTLIGTDGVSIAATGLSGIDFSSYSAVNMTTFLKGPASNFIVDGNGNTTIAGTVRFNVGASANGSIGLTQTCTVNQAKTIIFTLGILTGGTCNT